ncbi:MAG: thiamine-phosphate kinase [Zetaproteobacteria bacterium]|nr:MAG: thiamine-phosphate kinase [Zetaproteobacteria bacterium]
MRTAMSHADYWYSMRFWTNIRHMAVGEFELIKRYFRAFSTVDATDLVLGIGDDASLHRMRQDMEWAVSTDSSVEGVHWPRDFPLDTAADRAVCAALSDLAAMGAHADCAWLNVVAASEQAVAEMGKGCQRALRRHGVVLAGGDTVCAPMNMIAVTVAGSVPAGAAMRRDAARPGESLWLAGRVGFAAYALQCWRQGARAVEQVASFTRVQPRLCEGERLRRLGVRCCVDVSDGLAQDAGHIAEASNVCLEIELSQLPDWNVLRRCAGERATHCALAGGEDYALLFTAPADMPGLDAFARPIGRCVAVDGAPCVRVFERGREIGVPGGYAHFG